MTITEFLEARIAEDEAAANMRGVGSHSLHLFDIVGTYNPLCPDCRGLPGTARALAECAAKRAIIRDYLAASNAEAWWSQDAHKTNAARAGAWTFTLRHLAAVYADHPDYDREWAL